MSPYRTTPQVEQVCRDVLAQALKAHEDEPSHSGTWDKIASEVVTMLARRNVYATCAAIVDLGPDNDVAFKIYVYPPMREAKCRLVIT